MFPDDQLISISSLQHMQFCPRQWGLIHLEQFWADNSLTAMGNAMHEKVHTSDSESRGDIKIARGLRIPNLQYGITGQTDAVEYHRSVLKDNAIELPNSADYWKPFPIEYKRGKPKSDDSDKVQLCAQVLCLEEMYHINIPNAAFFYGQIKKRLIVEIDHEIRSKTIALISQLHELIRAGKTPKGEFSKKCKSCSLIETCMPKSTNISKQINRYINSSIQ